MGYDPQALGARCDQCILAVLREGQPVPPETRNAEAALVAEAPGEQEVRHGRPLVGPAGMKLDHALRDNGMGRNDFDLFHALACRPPRNTMKLVRSKLAAENRERDTRGWPRLPDPVDACRPRLLRELAHVRPGRPHTRVVTTGKEAYRALVPPPLDEDGKRAKHPSIVKLNGTLYHGPLVADDGKAPSDWQVQLVPTVHPSYVLHKPSFTMPFYRALDRARRWWTGQLGWKEPEVTLNPPLSALTSWVAWARSQPVLYYDTETTNLEPTWADLKTIQIGTGEHVLILAIRGHDGHRLVNAATEAAYLNATRQMLAAPDSPPIAGHNAGSYDKQVMQRVGIDVRLDLDTVILHRYCDPDLPHDLGFVGATYTDVPEWKSEGKGTADDETLHHYGALDVAANARAGKKLVDKAWRKWRETSAVTGPMKPLPLVRPLQGSPGAAWCRTLPPDPVLFHDHQMQAVCVRLHQRGIYVDQEARRKHDVYLQEQETKWIDKVQGAVAQVVGSRLETGYDRKGEPLFNPRSIYHLRRFLFDVLDLPPPEHLPTKAVWTDSDERSTGDAVLRAYLADSTLDADVHRALHAIRRAKKFRTLHGRFIKKLCLPHERPDDVDWIAVWADGRVRVNWSVHTTGVGRLSSGGRPASLNMQTIPSVFRDCFVARPGYVLVAADLANIHLRLIANLWHIPSLLEDYAKGRDPHATLAMMVFGDRFRDADGWKDDTRVVYGLPPQGHDDWCGDAKAMRNIAKTLRYAGAYGAKVPTIHATMTRAEDKDGNLTMRTLTVNEVRAYYNAWMGAEPEWQLAWDKEVGMYRQHGFVLSPLLGRRADFTDGEDFNKLANFRILSGEADIMGPATVRVDNRLRAMGCPEDAGLIGQFHDAMLLEVPEHMGEAAKRVLEEEMNIEVPGWPVPITADAAIGHRWKDVN